MSCATVEARIATLPPSLTEEGYLGTATYVGTNRGVGATLNPLPAEVPRYPRIEAPEHLDTDLAAAAHLARALGLPGANGQRFACVVEGHQGCAAIRRDPHSGRFKYCCEHQTRWQEKWWTLAHVRAARGYKRLRGDLSQFELVSWWLRLAHEADLYWPEPVRCRTAVPELTCTQRKVLDGLRLLVRLRGGAPVAFARTFASAWCGVGVRQAGQAVRQLLEHGHIFEVGTYSAGQPGSRRGRLVLPAGIRP